MSPRDPRLQSPQCDLMELRDGMLGESFTAIDQLNVT